MTAVNTFFIINYCLAYVRISFYPDAYAEFCIAYSCVFQTAFCTVYDIFFGREVKKFASFSTSASFSFPAPQISLKHLFSSRRFFNINLSYHIIIDNFRCFYYKFFPCNRVMRTIRKNYNNIFFAVRCIYNSRISEHFPDVACFVQEYCPRI